MGNAQTKGKRRLVYDGTRSRNDLIAIRGSDHAGQDRTQEGMVITRSGVSVLRDIKRRHIPGQCDYVAFDDR